MYKKINNKRCTSDCDNCRKCANYYRCLNAARHASVLKERSKKQATSFLSVVLSFIVFATGFVVYAADDNKGNEEIVTTYTERMETIYSQAPDMTSGGYVDLATTALPTSNELESYEIHYPDSSDYIVDYTMYVDNADYGDEYVEESTEVTIENNNVAVVAAANPTVEDTPVAVETVAEPTSGSYVYNLSLQDKIYIAKLVYQEARGESFEGQVAVAAVVLNRFVTGGGFDNSSILAVITQDGQFASISGVSQSNLDANPSCMMAVESACMGNDPTRAMFPNGALYFYAPSGVSGYQARVRSGIVEMPIGNHNFHVSFSS